jgi:hypothetical protein
MTMATTTTRRQTPAQARKAAIESDYTPLYAAAGLTDLVAESIKNIVLTTQEKATQRLIELQSKSTEQARSASGFVRTLPEQVKAFPEQLKALPETTKARLAELEKQRRELLAEAGTTYVDLAGRGKKVVDDSLIAARKTTADVKADVEDKLDEVREDVIDAVDPAFEAVQEGVTKARQTVSGKTATETVTPKSAAKASATRQAGAAKASATREAASAKRSAAGQKAAATRKANAAKKVDA